MMNGFTITFDNVYDEDKWNAEKNKYENDDEWSKDETIEDFYYNFDDNITEMIEKGDEPIISDLIRNYIWSDICKKKKYLLKMFKIIYEETENISFTFYNSNYSSNKFNNIGFFELWNDITDEFNYFIIKDTGISTSSQMSIWIGELYEAFEEYQGKTEQIYICKDCKTVLTDEVDDRSGWEGTEGNHICMDCFYKNDNEESDSDSDDEE